MAEVKRAMVRRAAKGSEKGGDECWCGVKYEGRRDEKHTEGMEHAGDDAVGGY